MKKALGKGLSSLIPDSYIKKDGGARGALAGSKLPGEVPAPQGFQVIPVSEIRPNPEQPRTEFSPEAIEELAASIQEKGVLQPVIVKRVSGGYELVCGERRLRATKLCGLSEIPAIVKDVADSDLLEWALIENIQREDLNPIEEAKAYQRLGDNQHLSQEDVAKRVGKDRSTVANTLRLLRLPEEIRQWIAEGRLTAGHSRALLGLLTPEHQRQMARRIVEENLSVRQVEALVHRSTAQKRKPRKARHLSPEIVDLEGRLCQFLGTQVKIYPRKDQKKGRLEIHYFSLDDLDRILEKLQMPSE